MCVVSKILLKMNDLDYMEYELLMYIIKCVNMMFEFYEI